jgi:hypothetical protein
MLAPAAPTAGTLTPVTIKSGGRSSLTIETIALAGQTTS